MRPMVAMIAALSIVLAGCAQIYAPAVALEGVDRAQYDADLAQCRSAAAATAPSVPEGFVKGAFLGALGGVAALFMAGAPGAADPSFGTVIAAVAAIGAIIGATVGAANAGEKTTNAVDDCLRARGYTVDA